MSEATEFETIAVPRRTPKWVAYPLAIFFGLFYAYDVWEAVGNLVGIATLASQLDTTINAIGWIVLIFGILLPVIVFALAYWMGRSRNVIAQFLLYLAGLGTVAALSLSIVALFGAGAVLN